MRVTIDALGTRLVQRDLLGFADRSADVQPAMEQALDLVRESASEQFESAGAHGSGGWAPLAPSTVARKARLGLNPGILRETTFLEFSLAGSGSGNIAIARKDGADYGTTAPYAKFHMEGTSRMPARPPLQLTEGERRDIIRIVQRYVVENQGGVRV